MLDVFIPVISIQFQSDNVQPDGAGDLCQAARRHGPGVDCIQRRSQHLFQISAIAGYGHFSSFAAHSQEEKGIAELFLRQSGGSNVDRSGRHWAAGRTGRGRSGPFKGLELGESLSGCPFDPLECEERFELLLYCLTTFGISCWFRDTPTMDRPIDGDDERSPEIDKAQSGRRVRRSDVQKRSHRSKYAIPQRQR
ncbi:hypothetical protein ATY79_15025 [Rhizobium sp. R693]|nr:hypothetical protein ATY79_15025 [Rhizobium sp. R693]